MSQCGTHAGAKAHNRHGEPLCDTCRAAERERARQYRLQQSRLATAMTPAQRTALRDLMDAPGWNERPCKDAKAWDIQRARGVKARDIVLEQVRDRSRRCSACPLLSLCRAYYDTNPPVTGVLAGRVLKNQDPTA